MTRPPSLAIGVDLGGTKLEAILLEHPTGPGPEDIHPPRAPAASAERLEQQVRRRIRVPTEAHRGYPHVVGLLVSLLETLLADVPPSERSRTPIGVGLPGHISRRTGRVKNSNTTCLNGQDLWGEVRSQLGRPIAFDNDANCMTLAEATYGAAAGAASAFGIILGTGVGGGLAIEGRVLSGLQGIAGEWGHNVLLPGRRCYCGKEGCVETWLSGPALERSFLEEAGIVLSAAALNQMLASDSTLPPGVAQVLDGYLERFGQAVSTLINVLDPEVVVIGGGLSRLAPLYTRGVEAVARSVFNDELLTRIVPASLGDAAGVYGAALLGEA